MSHKTLTFHEILLNFEHQQALSHVVATLSELIAQATLQLLIKIDETWENSEPATSVCIDRSESEKTEPGKDAAHDVA